MKTLSISFACLASSALAAEVALPRYHFEPGQEIVYEASSDFHYANGAHHTKGRLTFWVTGQNADGSWHLVGHSQSEFSQSHEGSTGGSPPQTMEVLSGFDLTAEGVIKRQPEGYQAGQLTAIFPPLPGTLEAARLGWESPDAESGEVRRYQLDGRKGPSGDEWVFRQSSKGLFNDIYLSTSESRYHFDTARGFFSRIESDYSQGWGFVGKGTGTQELKSITPKEPEWMAQFARESDRLFACQAALRTASEDKKNLAPALAQAEAKLREIRTQTALPFLQAQCDRQFKDLAESTKYQTEEQAEQATIQDKASPDWQFTDLDGQSHALADYRGKVIILDFWYRGCGWCIRAMPQIKEVVEHYKGKPVAVLGMNTDSNEKDARFVVEKLALNYPTLKAQGLPDKYKVRGFPTLIIIDQDGIVRGRHTGYSPTLRDTVIHDIDALLTEPRK